MIDVSELMTDPDFARTFIRRRPRGAFSDDGEFTSAYDENRITGIVQPAKPSEIQMLPEGSRLGNIISVWSSEELRVADAKRQESDVLIVDGQSYRVIKSEPWPDAGYFRVFAEGFIP